MNRTLAARLFSPTGFVLVLLTFLLPFLAVACQAGGSDGRTFSFSATFTGVDLVVGGTPTVTSSIDNGNVDEASEPIDAQPLAIAAVIVLVAGIAVAFIRRPIVRLAAGAGTGIIGAAMIFAAEFQARSTLVDLVRASVEDVNVNAEDFVRTRYGFWLALILALGVALGNAVALTRALRVVPGEGETLDMYLTDGDLSGEPPGDPPGPDTERTDPGLSLFDDRRD